jgi:hypothetical protein
MYPNMLMDVWGNCLFQESLEPPFWRFMVPVEHIEDLEDMQ